MIDPITAFATAQAAVAGIQKALKLGKDITGCIKEFSQLFESADVVNKAANEANAGKSDAAKAMEIVMQQNKLREDMEHLKHQLVYGGYPELWTLFLQKHMEIQRARKKREAEEKAAKLKRRQETAMFALYTVITVGFVAFLIGFVYIIMSV
jgi:plasmid maintenance system antidote protein VapI